MNARHPPRRVAMRYKKDLGGEVFPRDEFLARWQGATALFAPELALLPASRSDEAAKGECCGDLLEMDLNLLFSNKKT
jgi:hypothetical protein